MTNRELFNRVEKLLLENMEEGYGAKHFTWCGLILDMLDTSKQKRIDNKSGVLE